MNYSKAFILENCCCLKYIVIYGTISHKDWRPTDIDSTIKHMRISDGLVVELLKKSHKVNEELLHALIEQQKTDKKPLQDAVIRSNAISEKDLTQLYAAHIGIPFVEIVPRNLRKEVLKLIPEHIALQYNVVLFDVTLDGTKLLAMEDPDDVGSIHSTKSFG